MRITRLLLRNYRVFADELDLDVPPGLVGVYGVNGAGKSSLVGAIPWALFGFSRTGNDDVRTSGIEAECRAEVELEHEGHLYNVCRTISGVNSTVRARAFADGIQVADGVRDTVRYVRSVLGLDDIAFRASVFAEQKQLAAFSGTTPAKRRELVLKLLGITPLDAARDRARADARSARADHDRVRSLLPDLEALTSMVDEAGAAGRAARAAAEAAGVELAERRRQLGVARRVHGERSVTAAEHAAVLAEGHEVRRHHDAAVQRMAELEAELAGLAGARARLAELEKDAAGLPEAEGRLRAVEALQRAESAVAALTDPEGDVEVPPPDESTVESARQAAEAARAALATSDALRAQAVHQRDAAAAAVEQSSGLSGQAGCPLCGQELGRAFETVQAHRTAELEAAEARVRQRSEERAALARSVDHATARARRAGESLEQARRAHTAWERGRMARASAEQALAEASAALDPPRRPADDQLAAFVDRLHQALGESHQLRGRLEREPRAQAELEVQRHERDSSAGRLETLRDKRRSLGYRPDDLAVASQALEAAEEALERADGESRTLQSAAARADATAEAAAAALAAAREQHASLVELGEQARHLGRLADLLGSFRNQLVGAVGPRLSRQAASLFAELTDAEYDELRVDPDTYGIEICDQGVAYGIDRFSGSETDLASLALRVAISEQLCFQSGGQIGLLVLDEVFGPLDADRKHRMLGALERLKGRFRQVLVVTHDNEIKEQLPSAIEVVKLPGRRATARVVDGMSGSPPGGHTGGGEPAGWSRHDGHG